MAGFDNSQQHSQMLFMMLSSSLQCVQIISAAYNNSVAALEKRLGLEHIKNQIGGDPAYLAIDTKDIERDANIARKLEYQMQKNHIRFEKCDIGNTTTYIINRADLDTVKMMTNQITRQVSLPGHEANGRFNLSPSINEYLNTIGKPHLDTVVWVNSEHVENYSNLLKNLDVEHEILRVNGKMGVFFDESKDISKVMYAYDNYLAQIAPPGQVDINLLREESKTGYANASPDIYKVEKVSQSTAVMLKNSAEKGGFHIAIEPISDDRYTVFYCGKDSKAFKDIFTSATITNALAGDIYEKFNNYNHEKSNQIHDKAILNYKEPFVIVDYDTKKVVQINEAGIVVDGDIETRPFAETFSDKNNLTRMLSAEMSNMHNPVILTNEQYAEFCEMTVKEQDDYLYQADVSNGRPELSNDELMKLYEAEQSRHLYEAKVINGGEIQEKLTYSYHDDKMMLSEFLAKEQTNQIFNHEQEVAVTLDAKTLDDLKETFREFNPTKMTLPVDTRVAEFLEFDEIERLTEQRIEEMEAEFGGNYTFSATDYGDMSGIGEMVAPPEWEGFEDPGDMLEDFKDMISDIEYEM